jgi:predicted peptidase
VLSSRDRIEQLKTLGVWAFHGAKDPVVPLEESQRMVDALKKVGVTEVKLTVYPEAGHNSWTETYNNPELYKWLLEHRRAAAAKR